MRAGWALTAVLLVILGMSAAGAHAQAPDDPPPLRFGGPYVSGLVSAQNIFGGSFIGGVEVLAQGLRGAVELAAGARGQLWQGRLLLGGELQYGRTNGDLMEFYAPRQSTVEYYNRSQVGLGVTFGWVPDARRRVALLGYVVKTWRKFDVYVQEGSFRYPQADRQNYFRYGGGAEVALFGSLHVTAKVGLVYADFSSLVTSKDLAALPELSAGLTYQIY